MFDSIRRAAEEVTPKLAVDKLQQGQNSRRPKRSARWLAIEEKRKQT